MARKPQTKRLPAIRESDFAKAGIGRGFEKYKLKESTQFAKAPVRTERSGVRTKSRKRALAVRELL